MKISKLLRLLLGVAFFSMGVAEEGGGGALDVHSAAEAFSSLDGDAGHEKQGQPVDETPEAVAERLAAEDAPKEVEGEPVAPAKFTIKVDGKDVSLTADEVAEHYKNGLRQADYTRKTMESADARKTADAETARTRQERDTYAQKLNNFAITTHGAIQEQQALLTQELLDSDPMEYLRQERTLRERQANLILAQQELQQIDHQVRSERAEVERNHFADQHEKLLAKFPAWKDPAKAKTESNQIKEYLGSQGYEAGERDFTDHRHIVLAHKAMQYDALIERAGKAVKKVAALPVKPERPGSTETTKLDGRTTVMKRLSQTGSIDDAAAAFGALG